MTQHTFASAHMLIRVRARCLGVDRNSRHYFIGRVSIADLRCDLCGRFLAGPGDGVRFVYHPGMPELRDDSAMACVRCWAALIRNLDTAAATRCAACAQPVRRSECLHVRRFDVPGSWRLCRVHAVGFLNALRTVEPKFDAATFRFPGEVPGVGPIGGE